MATFLTLIENYIGTFSNTTALDNWLNEAGHKVVDTLSADRLNKYATSLTDAGSGISIANYRVMRAHKSNYGAILVDASLSAWLIDSNSIYYATIYSPAWYIDSGKAYVFPSGGTIIATAYPAITNTTVAGSTQFLLDFEDIIVIYASMRGLLQNINSEIAIVTALSYTTQSIITHDITTQLSEIATYIDTDADYELAQGKIGEVTERLNDAKIKIEESGQMISQEQQSFNSLVQKSLSKIQSYLQLLGQLNANYKDLLGGLQ